MNKFHWQTAQVVAVFHETPRVKTVTLQLSHWIPHLPGQHYDIRLTAEMAIKLNAVIRLPLHLGKVVR
jgi:ferredoxin-NADP reductase